MRARVYAGCLAGAASALGLWAWWPPVYQRYWAGMGQGPARWPGVRWGDLPNLLRAGEAAADVPTVFLGLALGMAFGLVVWSGWGLWDCWRGRKMLLDRWQFNEFTLETHI